MAQKELDRFAKQYKKNMQIQTKLMGIVAGAVLISCTITSMLTLTIFNSKMMTHEKARIETNAEGVIRIVDDWKLQLTQYSYLFSINPDVAQALYDDDGSLNAITDDIISHLDLDFYAVTDAAGNILKADGLNGNITGCSSVAKALRGEPSWSYEGIGSQNYAIISANPIKYEGSIVGTVIFGYGLDNELLCKEAQEGYDIECTVFKGDTRVDTTIRDASGNKLIGTRQDNQEVLSQVLKGGKHYVGDVTINGDKYVSDYAPLVSKDGTITGMLFVAKSLSALE